MRSHDDKAEFFDQYAEQWDQEGFSDEQMEKVGALLTRLEIKPGMTILEPGCGSGRLTKVLSELVGPAGHVIAVDISPKMIEVCGRATKNRNVRALLGEIEKVKLDDQSVDLVLCFAAFPHFNDKPAALKAFARCLKPDGRLVIAHLLGSVQINDLHRKAGTPVECDAMPAPQELECLFQETGLRIDELTDEKEGYFLLARRSIPPPERLTPYALGIVASPRKGGNTDTLVERVLDGARAQGLFTRKLYIGDLAPSPCTSCRRCIQHAHCVQRDGMEEVYELLPAADLLVFGVPIYLSHINAQAKTVIDRMFPFLVGHPKRTKLDGKPAVLVVTQGNMVPNFYIDVTEWLRRTFKRFFGIVVKETIHQYGNLFDVKVHADPWLMRRAWDAPGVSLPDDVKRP